MFILVNGNNYQSTHIDNLRSLITGLSALPDVRLAMMPEFLDYLRTIMPDIVSDLEQSSVPCRPDLMLSIGGDGTFLATAAMAAQSEIPVMGINSGHLGYLAAARLEDTDEIVASISSRSYLISARSLLQITTDDPSEEPRYALNDVAFVKRTTASMITVNAQLCTLSPTGGYCAPIPLAEYLGDGLIVSTPTGSTGYNLSVGGPIIAPSSPCIVVSPIAPHSLTMRPLILPDTVRLIINASSRAGSFLVSVDGHSIAYLPDRTFYIEKAPFVVNLVHLPDHTFIQTLHNKLLWGVDGR